MLFLSLRSYSCCSASTVISFQEFLSTFAIVDRPLDPAILSGKIVKMAEAVASVALETLRDLLIEEAKVLSGVGDQVDDVRRQLKTMHCFLKDASKRQDTDNSETIRNWVRELRDLATQAEIILERYAVEVTSRRKARNFKGILKRFTCILSECLSMHQIGKETESIRSRMIDLTKQLESISSKWDSSSSSADDTDWSRKTFGHGVEQYFVGMKEERQLLESLLTNDDHSSNQVISICGMGGLGKTSLARKVYQGEAVQRWFEARAWICISQQFQPRTIFQGLLKKLLPHENVEQHDDDELVRRLYDAQKEKKCLVILDDIWKAEDWNSLRHAFPIGESGSRILLTTRNQNIASTGYVHRLECLSEDEGWELLQKIALPNNYSQELPIIEIKQLEEYGREIVQKCGSLPLPISVIGGVLRQENKPIEWEKVCRNIDSYLQHGKGMEKDKRVEQILDLSYNLLPYNLKSCFLYLGCFREDEDMEPENLYLLWMAEGMISLEDTVGGESLRDVAERYLYDLANKCFVEVVDRQMGRADESSICKTSSSIIGGENLKLDGLNELETLIEFNSLNGDITNLLNMPKLRVLNGRIWDEGSMSMIIDHILNHQDQFRNIELHIHGKCNVNQEKDGSTLLRRLLMCRSLSFLEIQVCPVSKLPAYEVQLYQNVIELRLWGTMIEEDPMEILEKLPVLRNLGLLNDAYVGREMVCRATGFPQLKYLDFWSLPNLVEWRVEKGAMPNLCNLHIVRCSKLEMIPDGLKFITTLNKLYIYEMPEELRKRVGVVDGEEGEDYHKIKHIPSIYIL
ncbi:putative disease resistance protein [Sesamum angolense]|uniref:Disease resistance protein n=1 Tax=Sesamum angolense TaxID=2727404 RepID=A0AAE2C2B1_9LAMI|nr:putative disease resistance protein [Sesamum angolense]